MPTTEAVKLIPEELTTRYNKLNEEGKKKILELMNKLEQETSQSSSSVTPPKTPRDSPVTLANPNDSPVSVLGVGTEDIPLSYSPIKGSRGEVNLTINPEFRPSTSGGSAQGDHVIAHALFIKFLKSSVSGGSVGDAQRNLTKPLKEMFPGSFDDVPSFEVTPYNDLHGDGKADIRNINLNKLNDLIIETWKCFSKIPGLTKNHRERVVDSTESARVSTAINSLQATEDILRCPGNIDRFRMLSRNNPSSADPPKLGNFKKGLSLLGRMSEDEVKAALLKEEVIATHIRNLFDSPTREVTSSNLSDENVHQYETFAKAHLKLTFAAFPEVSDYCDKIKIAKEFDQKSAPKVIQRKAPRTTRDKAQPIIAANVSQQGGIDWDKVFPEDALINTLQGFLKVDIEVSIAVVQRVINKSQFKDKLSPDKVLEVLSEKGHSLPKVRQELNKILKESQLMPEQPPAPSVSAASTAADTITLSNQI
jgi:hypothetical protein